MGTEAMNRDVWVLLEIANKKLESHSIALTQEGKRLSDQLDGKLCAVMIGPKIEQVSQIVGEHGVAHLYHGCEERLSQYDPEVFERFVAGLLLTNKPYLFLSTATSLGSDLMPRLAAKMKAPLVTNCIEIRAQDEIEFIRPIQNGRLHATVVCRSKGIRMATMNPEALIPTQEAKLQQVAEVTECTVAKDEPSPRIRVTGFLRADHRTIDVSEAEFLLAIGKGMGPKDNLSMYRQFADQIGAAIGVTRPVVDEGILPFERQIGQTGKEVSPKLLVMCGISGAIEFTKGVEGARTKIAINTDRKAPVFRSADLGIVGDVNEVVPKIIEFVKTKGDRD
jgi:electron transfer flavoprotein alpha subunit